MGAERLEPSILGDRFNIQDPVELPEAEADTPENTPLSWGAQWLVKNFSTAIGKYSAEESLGASTAQQRVQAAAAFAMSVQHQCLEDTADLVLRMVRLKQWRGVLFAEHTLYDETAMQVRMRFPGGPLERQTGKIMMIERTWTMLLEVLPSSLDPTPSLTSTYVELKGHYSPALRGTAGTSGEDIFEILKSTPPLPMTLQDCFQGFPLVRMVEVDDYGGNARAETFMMQRRGEQWTKLSLVCLCHKVHAMASKSWPLHGQLVSSLIHSCKVLAQSGAMMTFRDSMTNLIKKRMKLVLVESTVLPRDAETFRANIMKYCLPPKSQPRRHVTVASTCEFLNGDWRLGGTLTHRCIGIQCCRDLQHCIDKACCYLQRLVHTLYPRMFNRGNWVSWADALGFFLLTSAIHGLLPDTFQEAFGSGVDEAQATQWTAALSTRNLPSSSSVSDDVFIEEFLVGAGETGAVQSEGIEAPETMQDDEARRWRAQNALSERIALNFMKPEMLFPVLLLRVSLFPESTLMTILTSACSRGWEEFEMYKFLESGTRDYRLLLWHKGDPFQAALDESMTLLQSSSLWLLQAETEWMRGYIFKAMVRPAAVCYQLLLLRCKGYPYKLFALLDTGSDKREVAQSLLDGPGCLKDKFSKDFLQQFPTVDLLTGKDSEFILRALGRQAFGSTYTTERLHSRNLKRTMARKSTHPADLAHLGLTHISYAGPMHRTPAVGKQARKEPHRPLGRPKKHKKRRRGSSGGGGAWRAYCHYHLQGQPLTASLMRSLAADYHALSLEQRQWYSDLGKAGRVLSQD